MVGPGRAQCVGTAPEPLASFSAERTGEIPGPVERRRMDQRAASNVSELDTSFNRATLKRRSERG
jgi:hypothetical protein